MASFCRSRTGKIENEATWTSAKRFHPTFSRFAK
jgi:hypothetical protein